MVCSLNSVYSIPNRSGYKVGMSVVMHLRCKHFSMKFTSGLPNLVVYGAVDAELTIVQPFLVKIYISGFSHT